MQSSPLSSIGGIYNIRRHTHQLRLLNLATPPRQVNFRPTPNDSLSPGMPTMYHADEPNRISPKYQPETNRLYDSDSSTSSTGRRLNGHQLPAVAATRPRTACSRRPKTQQVTAKPAIASDRRCKTATGNLDTPRTGTAKVTAASAGVQSANKACYTSRGPNADTGVRMTRSRATKTSSDPPSTPIHFAMYRRQLKTSTTDRPADVAARNVPADYSDGKAIRRLSNGVPTHTAARAAVRLEKAKCSEQEYVRPNSQFFLLNSTEN